MGKGRGKGTKKGWKQVGDGGLSAVLREVHARREVAAKPDSELFFEDVEASEPMTHRQKRALEHRNRMESLDNALEDDKSEVKAEGFCAKTANFSCKFDVKGKMPAKKGRKRYQRQQLPYDIWECEGRGDDSAKKLKKRPMYVPSALPAVMPPREGASYNPPVDSYLKMVEQMAEEEQKIERKERRTERIIGISEEEVVKCQGIREEIDCFTRKDEPSAESLKEEEVDEDGEAQKAEKKLAKSKSEKEKKRQKRRRAEAERAKADRKTEGKRKQQLQNLKSLKRQVNEHLEKQTERITRKRGERQTKALTKRKRLGRGKFEPYEEPVLLADELPSSLRQLSPQGNIIAERIKSLQQRNILPIAGERPTKLKSRLKAKLVEKRAVKEVTEDSRVI